MPMAFTEVPNLSPLVLKQNFSLVLELIPPWCFINTSSSICRRALSSCGNSLADSAAGMGQAFSTFAGLGSGWVHATSSWAPSAGALSSQLGSGPGPTTSNRCGTFGHLQSQHMAVHMLYMCVGSVKSRITISHPRSSHQAAGGYNMPPSSYSQVFTPQTPQAL